MQLHNAADGHEHKMSAVYPVWSSSTSNVCDNTSSVDAHGRYRHWWPSQAYHCTFCTRVFRTAQALGGHMNIHRRERACANDMGTHVHIRRDSTTNCSTTTLSESGRLPASIIDQRSPLFGGSHRLLMTRTPPPSTNSMASSISCTENCYASRRIASQPPASNYNVPTHLLSANFAPIPADVTCLTEQAPRAGCNGGNGHLEVAKLEYQSGCVNNTISDPLSWLFSQLPPPGSVTNLQQSHSGCRSNILMQKNLAKPYHRALAVSKSPPGVRRSACHPSPLSVQNVQNVQSPHSWCRGVAGESSSGAAQGGASAAEESLDLELRL